MAMAKPRTGKAGELGPGGASGGEIFARTRILFNGWIDIIIASTELARAAAGASSVVGDVLNGGSLRDASGCGRPFGLGGGPIVTLLFLRCRASRRGRDSRRFCGNGNGVSCSFGAGARAA